MGGHHFRCTYAQQRSIDSTMAQPIRVVVTGAAGQIAYSLLYQIAKGDVFGADQPPSLHLLDIEPMMGVLNGVVMELQDCALPLLREVFPLPIPQSASKTSTPRSWSVPCPGERAWSAKICWPPTSRFSKCRVKLWTSMPKKRSKF